MKGVHSELRMEEMGQGEQQSWTPPHLTAGQAEAQGGGITGELGEHGAPDAQPSVPAANPRCASASAPRQRDIFPWFVPAYSLNSK